MSRLTMIEKDQAQGKAKELLEGIQKNLGKTANIFKLMANSPAVLQAYLGFSAALKGGVLDAKTRERIALLVGELNNCQYCLAAHSLIGKGAGLNDDEITGARKGVSADAKTQAILILSKKIVGTHGNLNDEDVEAAKHAGLNDGEIAEVVANVCFNLFTNYFNHVTEPEIDFPQVQPVS